MLASITNTTIAASALSKEKGGLLEAGAAAPVCDVVLTLLRSLLPRRGVLAAGGFGAGALAGFFLLGDGRMIVALS